MMGRKNARRFGLLLALALQLTWAARAAEPPKATPAKPTKQQLEKAKANAQRRNEEDRNRYTPLTLSMVEKTYQIANKSNDYSSPDVRRAMEAVLSQCPGCNRAGCAVAYLGYGSTGAEAIRWYRMAVQRYDDCWWNDGVQVGAMARYRLMLELRKSGEQSEATALEKELRQRYADALHHDGTLLVSKLKSK